MPARSARDDRGDDGNESRRVEADEPGEVARYLGVHDIEMLMLEREGERDTLVSRTEQRCNRDPRRLRGTRGLEDGLQAGHRLAGDRPDCRPRPHNRTRGPAQPGMPLPPSEPSHPDTEVHTAVAAAPARSPYSAPLPG